MMILGLILTILFCLAILGGILVYLISYIRGKYNFCNETLTFIFLFGLCALMGLTWSLIIMNNGFDVNTMLNLDYTYILIIFIPLFIILSIIDMLLQRKLCTDMRGFKRVFRYILPALCDLIIFIAIILAYFNINYFIYLNM